MGLALSPDGQTLAVCVWQVVRLYEFGSWKELGTLAGHQGVLQGAAFSPGGKLLVTASFDGTIKLWNVAAKQEVTTLRGHVDAVNGVAFSFPTDSLQPFQKTSCVVGGRHPRG